jgi:hypothetical protein
MEPAMKRALFAFFVLTAIVLAVPMTSAQDAAPDSENGRYSFNQVPEGLLRLDSRTGHVSLCGKRAAGWACQVVPDERTALEAEIGRLQNETASLKRELISRGIALPGATQNPERPGAKNNDLTLKLPSDADIDRAMTFFEKIWRRLVDMVQNMQREMDKKNAEKEKS